MSFYSESYPTAKKRHQCAECYRPIELGEIHKKSVLKSDVTNYKVAQIRLHESCARRYGQWKNEEAGQ